jgi:hypothetical protein
VALTISIIEVRCMPGYRAVAVRSLCVTIGRAAGDTPVATTDLAGFTGGRHREVNRTHVTPTRSTWPPSRPIEEE